MSDLATLGSTGTVPQLSAPDQLRAQLDALDSDPGFAALPYSDQQAVRASWFNKFLPSDPGFAALPIADQRRVYTSWMLRAPAIDQRGLTETGLELLQVAEAAKAGDPEAADAALSRVFRVNLNSRLGWQRRLFDFTSGLFDNEAALPALEGVAGRESESVLYTPQEAEDLKAYAYLTEVLGARLDTRERLAKAIRGGTWAGFGIDIASTVATSAAVVAGIAAGAGAVGLPGLAATLTPSAGGAHLLSIGSKAAGRPVTSAFGRWFLGSAAPHLAQQSLPEGLLFTLGSYYRDSYANDEWFEDGFAAGSLRTLGTFGREVLFDIGMHQILRFASTKGRALSDVMQPRGYRGKPSDIPLEELVPQLRQFNEEVVRRLPDVVGPDEAARMVRKQMEKVRASRIATGAEPFTVDGYMRTMLAAQGFDLVDEADGLVKLADMNVERLGSTEVKPVGSFRSISEAWVGSQRYLDQLELKQFNQIGRQAGGELGVYSGKVALTEIVDAPVAALPKGVRSNLQELLRPDVNGRINPTRIQAFYRNALKGDVAKGTKVQVLPVSLRQFDELAGGGKIVEVGPLVDGGRTVVVRTPVPNMSPGQVAQVQRAIVQASNEIAGVGARRVAVPKKIRDAAELVSKQYDAQERVALDLLASRGARIEPMQGGFALLEPTGTRSFYTSQQELVMSELGKGGLVDPRAVQDYVREQFGLRIIEENGRFSIKGAGRTTRRSATSYPDLSSLLKDNPDFFPKINVPSGMQVIYGLDEGLAQVSRTAVRGGLQEVLDHMDSAYRNPRQLKRVIDGAYGSLRFDTGTSRFRVHLDDLNFTRTFDSLEDAKAYLRKGQQSAAELTDIALAKGAYMEYLDGNWVITQMGKEGVGRIARSLDEARDIIRTLPGPTDAIPEIDFGLPRAFMEQLSGAYRKQMGVDIGLPRLVREGDLTRHVRRLPMHSRKLAPTGTLERFVRPVNGAIHDLAEDIGKPELYDAVFRAPMAKNALYQTTYNATVDTVEKIVKNADATKRQFYLAALHADDASAVAKQFGFEGVSVEDSQVITELRRLLDFLGEEFGIDGYKWLSNYRPQIRKYFTSKGADKSGDPVGVLRRALGGKFGPVEEDFFANKLRVTMDDLIDTTNDEDVVEAILGYARMGYRAKHLAPAFNDARAVINRLVKEGDIDMQTAKYLVGFQEDLLGRMSDPTKQTLAKGIEEIVTGFFKTLNIKGAEKIGRDYAAMLNSISTAAFMSFKPWMAVRNMQQIWQTLAPRFGNDVVLTAIERVNQNGEEILKLMRASGAVQGRAGIQLMDAATPNKFLKFFNTVGMKQMLNSDDFTRMVAWETARLTFDDAFERMSRGLRANAFPTDILQKQFVELSGIGVLKPGDQAAILKTLEAGHIDEARRLFQTQTVYDTMFGYVEATNPLLFKGHELARMFGKYGHFSVNYLEGLRTMFGAHRPMKARLGSAALLAGNSFALWAMFEKVMGVNAASFNPVFQAMFSGGPYFGLFAQMAQSTQPGFKGEIARSNLAGQLFRGFVPGASVMANLRSGASLYERGYAYEGILRAFGGFPMLDPDVASRR